MNDPAASAPKPISATKTDKRPDPIDFAKAVSVAAYPHPKTGQTAALHFAGCAYTATGIPIGAIPEDFAGLAPKADAPHALGVTAETLAKKPEAKSAN
jgi:hypothetical protein